MASTAVGAGNSASPSCSAEASQDPASHWLRRDSPAIDVYDPAADLWLPGVQDYPRGNFHDPTIAAADGLAYAIGDSCDRDTRLQCWGAIPEPAALGLLAVAGAAVTRRRRRMPRRE